jgi:GNAT superfamily N-acetyltransferase
VTDPVITQVRYGAPIARTLTAAALADLTARYGGEGDGAPIEAMEFDPPEGCFLVATVDGQPAGCGGWRSLASDVSVAEIKRMYVVPEFRGRGVARAILAMLEETARAAGKKRMALETGTAQPEAIALYERCGYERITDFGYYKDYDDVRSFGRTL